MITYVEIHTFYYFVYKYASIFGSPPPVDCHEDVNIRATLFTRAPVRAWATNIHRRLNRRQEDTYLSHKLIINDTYAAIN